jgi:hypothetical protein
MRHREQPRQQRTLVPLELPFCRCRIRKDSLGQLLRLAGVASPTKEIAVHLAVVAPKRLLGWAPHHMFLAHPGVKVTPCLSVRRYFGLSPSSLAAFSLRISGRTSSLNGASAKSASQRSGVSSGKSEPKSTFSRSCVFAYWTS